MLEKSTFPREKVCGDGLTPRAVKALTAMGIPTGAGDGWLRNKGLRIIGGGGRIELPWPDLSSYPAYGLVRTRLDFDQLLAGHAEKAGARIRQGITVTGPVLDDRTGRIAGVIAHGHDGRQGRAASFGSGRLVVCRGRQLLPAVGGRWACASATTGRSAWPCGPTTPARGTPMTWLEAWLDLWDGESLLPGYGWVFGMGDGTSNVGLGLLNTSVSFQNADYRAMLRRWLATMPPEWGLTEENRTQPIRGAALPMGFNRTPHYTRGLLLAGDAGGMVNPFNGEGIAYAMESGEIAARVIAQALARPGTASAERVLQSLPADPARQLRWLLHARPGLRRADRQAGVHALRHASTA